jgi:hypothetical protein
MNKGDIYLTKFPLGGTVGAKPRPALLLTGLVGPVPEVLTAYISSVMPSTLLATDLVLDPQLPHRVNELEDRFDRAIPQTRHGPSAGSLSLDRNSFAWVDHGSRPSLASLARPLNRIDREMNYGTEQ